MDDPKIILCVPGPWVERKELVLGLASADLGYLFAGFVLMHTPSNRGWELDFCGRDARMESAFRSAGFGRMEEQDFQRIGKHRSVAYILSDQAGVASAQATREAACALLKVGGLGIKCEVSGIAHAPQRFTAATALKTPDALVLNYVQLVSGEREFYTCGMQVFGLPEAAIRSDLDLQAAWDLLYEFCIYNVAESPRLLPGETFGVNANAPRYKLRHAPCRWYPPGHEFINPHGVWWLDGVPRR